MIITTLCAMPFSAQAKTIKGTGGEDITFTFDTVTKTMEFSYNGTGEGWLEDTKDNGAGKWWNEFDIKKLIIGKGITDFDQTCFRSLVNLEELEMKSVSTIPMAAFEFCTSLSSVKLGNVKDIGEQAFLGCDSLEEIFVPITVNHIGEYALGFHWESENTLGEGYYPNSGFSIKARCDNNAVKTYLNNYGLTDWWNKTHAWTDEGAIIHKRASFDNSGSMTCYCRNGCTDEQGNKVTTKITIPAIKSAKLSKTRYVANGKVKRPIVTVTDTKGDKLVSGFDYSVKYNAKTSVGKYSVKVTFKGKYTGTKELSYAIVPPATKLVSVTSAEKGAIKVKWNKKESKYVEGYQVKVSKTKDFKKDCKTYYVKGNSKTTKTVTGLEKGKKYYVVVRTYKYSGRTRYYSDQSNIKSVTVKK